MLYSLQIHPFLYAVCLYFIIFISLCQSDWCQSFIYQIIKINNTIEISINNYYSTFNRIVIQFNYLTFNFCLF